MRKRWSDDEIAKLKSWAGKRRSSEIAADLGRAESATVVKACQLKISLRFKPSMDPGAGGTHLEEAQLPAS